MNKYIFYGLVIPERATNLQKSGFYGWSELYLPNNDEIKLPAQTYKTAVREMLTKSGYDIILNIGDQDNDQMVVMPNMSIRFLTLYIPPLRHVMIRLVYSTERGGLGNLSTIKCKLTYYNIFILSNKAASLQFTFKLML